MKKPTKLCLLLTVCRLETQVYLYQTTRRYIPGVSLLHTHHREWLNSKCVIVESMDFCLLGESPMFRRNISFQFSGWKSMQRKSHQNEMARRYLWKESSRGTRAVHWRASTDQRRAGRSLRKYESFWSTRFSSPRSFRETRKQISRFWYGDVRGGGRNTVWPLREVPSIQRHFRKQWPRRSDVLRSSISGNFLFNNAGSLFVSRLHSSTCVHLEGNVASYIPARPSSCPH